jgi:hypothetical protein
VLSGQMRISLWCADDSYLCKLTTFIVSSLDLIGEARLWMQSRTSEPAPPLSNLIVAGAMVLSEPSRSRRSPRSSVHIGAKCGYTSAQILAGIAIPTNRRNIDGTWQCLMIAAEFFADCQEGSRS